MSTDLDNLLDDPTRFDFFSALAAIERALPDAPPIGYAPRPSDEAHRIEHSPNLAFVSSDVRAARHDANRIRLETHFLGLFGPNGPMPLHITEYAYHRLRDARDPSLTGFLNIFHHRLLTLFYRAWADAQPQAIARGERKLRHERYVGSLLGIGTPDFDQLDHFPDTAKLRLASAFIHQRRDAETLERILSAYLTHNVHIEQFVGSWLEIPGTEYSRAGSQFCSLGVDATAGTRVWDGAARVRIVIGPLTRTDFERYLPDSDACARLVACVRFYLGDELDWEYQLLLKADDVTPVRLGQAGKLGWSSWIGDRSDDAAADDVVLHPKLSLAHEKAA